MKRTPGSKHSAAKPASRRQPAPKNHSDALTLLEDAQLVRRLTEPDPTFIFKNALTQESAYASLLNRTRRAIHLEVARVYENLFPQQLDEYAALLAQHYAEGGDDAKALEYATRAGDVAQRVYANAEAIAHYTRAIEIALRTPTPRESSRLSESLEQSTQVRDDSRALPRRTGEGETSVSLLTRLYLQRGRVHELKAEYEPALENYRALHALGRERGERAMELASLMATLPIYATPTSAHDPEMAKMISGRALALARELGDRAAEAKILWSLMLFTRWIGDPAQAVKFGEESLMIARTHNLREQMAYALNDLGVHGYMDTGQYRQGLESVKQAQIFWREANNLPMLADSYGGIALLSYGLGNYDDVIAASNEASRISESIENLWGQSYAIWAVGNTYSDRGEPARALQVMEECIRLGEQAGFAGAEVGVRVEMAAVCADYGLYARGIAIAERAVELADAKFTSWKPWARAVQARLYVRVGKIAEAVEIVRSEREHWSAMDMGRVMGFFAANLELAEAEIALAQNAVEFNASQLQSLAAFLEKSEGYALLSEVMLAQARIGVIQGKDDIARAAVERAQEIAGRMTQRRVLWQVYALLSEIAQKWGDADAALGFRVQARELVEYIAQHADEEQRARFLSLEKVKTIMQT